MKPKYLFFGFILPLIFWIYLAFSSTMTVAHDAQGFEINARNVKLEGIKGYFKYGPQKEPLYAYSISLSMKLSDVLGIDYKKIQTCLQILLLLLGQYALYRLLLLLELNKTVITAALLYYGFSPALISCGFNLYSEIMTMPFIILSVFFVSKIWHFVLQSDRKTTALYALFFTLTATTATFSKAVLIVVYPLFLIPFMIMLIFSLLKGKPKQGQAVAIFLIIFFSIFGAAIHSYQSLNKKYLGKYVFTDDRGGPMLYTLAIKRTTPLTKEALGLALSIIPGENICRKFYGELCTEWMYGGSADLGYQKSSELASQNIPEEKVRSMLGVLAFKQILSNPLQYIFFTFLEALKMFFWESTKIGFVIYPQWLTQIYDNFFIKNTLRLFVALATLFSTAFAGIWVFKTGQTRYAVSDQAQRDQSLFFLFFFLMLFIGLYALARTVTRYSLPIAPLFITAIAFTFNEVFFTRAKGMNKTN